MGKDLMTCTRSDSLMSDLFDEFEEYESEAASNDWLRAGACTACGLRPSNEDQHVLECNWYEGKSGASPRSPPGTAEDGAAPAALFAVCDGHGGAAIARSASRLLPK